MSCSNKLRFHHVKEAPGWNNDKNVRKQLGELYSRARKTKDENASHLWNDNDNDESPLSHHIKVNFILNKNVSSYFVWPTLQEAAGPRTVRNAQNESAIKVAKQEIKNADDITKQSVYIVFCSHVTHESSRKLMPTNIEFDRNNCTYYAPGLSVIRFISVEEIVNASQHSSGIRLPIPDSFKTKIRELRQMEFQNTHLISSVSLISKYPQECFRVATDLQREKNISMLSTDFVRSDYLHENDISGQFLSSSLMCVGTRSMVKISPGARTGDRPSTKEMKHRHPPNPKTFVSIISSSDDYNCVACSFYNLMKLFYTDKYDGGEFMKELSHMCSMTGFKDVTSFCVSKIGSCRDAQIKSLSPPKNNVFDWVKDLNNRKFGIILELVGNKTNITHCVACFDDEIIDSTFPTPLDLTEENLSFCLGDTQQLMGIGKCYIVLLNSVMIDNYLGRFKKNGSSYEEMFKKQFIVDVQYFRNPKELFRKGKKRTKKRKERSRSFDY